MASAPLASDESPRGKLVLLHAGSLTVPMEEVCEEFQRLHPEVDVEREIAGSRTCARKVSDLGRECDVLASADYRVIDQLLIPEHAGWNIRFAANELVLVYSTETVCDPRFTQSNWPDRLKDPKIHYGRADPNSDPCGYRTVLALRLAGLLMDRPGLADSLLNKDNVYIRPKETDLLALLEMCVIDCLFIYRSVAEQHGLEYLELPAEVNLGDPAQNEFYRRASVSLTGKKPGEWIEVRGEAMVYGVTIPTNSPNPETALSFLHFLLSPEGGRPILERNGQPWLVPSPTDTWDKVPPFLREFVLPE